MVEVPKAARQYFLPTVRVTILWHRTRYLRFHLQLDGIDSLTIRQFDVPTAQHGQVLVKIHTVSLNVRVSHRLSAGLPTLTSLAPL